MPALITGEGLRKVAFVADRPNLDHWMTSRLLRRAGGLQKEYFHFIDRDDPDLGAYIKRYDLKVLIPLGEGALRRLIGETDLIRWRGRVVPYQGIWAVPTFAPSKLLPQRGDEDSDEIMRSPPRYQGSWVRDVMKALDIATNGFTRIQATYVLDPAP